VRVAMYYSNRDVRIEEMPVPSIQQDEVLMRIESSGICGSDVMEWYRKDKVPLVLGHEVSGIVEKVGDEVSKFEVGDRVIAAHHVPCNTCHYCLKGDHTVCDTLRKTNFYPGGFAEYVRLPAINVDRGTFRIPDDMSFDAATFIEPVACVIRGQQRAGLKHGLSVLVLGSGIAGVLHVCLARASGAGLIVATDVIEHRLEAAAKFGADVVLHAQHDIPEEMRRMNRGRLADIVIVSTGAVPAIKQALESVERGGTILFFAPTESPVIIPKPINEIFWRSDVTLTTSYAGSPADHVTAMRLIAKGNVPVMDMITHKLALKDTGLGFQMVANPQSYTALKVIVHPCT